MENLKRLNDLCCAFRDTAEIQIELAEMAGSDVGERLEAAFARAGQPYAFQRDYFPKAQKPAAALQEDNPEAALRSNIRKIDLIAGILLAEVGQEAVADCMPDELRNANDATALRFIGAGRLSKLCGSR